MVFKVFHKLFTTIINFLSASLKFLTNFENAYPPQNFFSVTGQCSLVPTSHWLQGKRARIVTCGFRYDLTESQAASVRIFCVKIAALVFRAGYWKDFQNCK
jgi:hypothetical protein